MNWLFKEEPTHYSFDDFVKDGKTIWSGVKNPLAQKHLHAVKKGDRVFYYHTGNEKAVVGIAKATSNAYRIRRQERQARGGGLEPVKKLAEAGDAGGDQGRPVVQDVSARPDLEAVSDAGDGRGMDAIVGS